MTTKEGKMVKKTTKKRGLVYFIAKVRLGSRYEVWDGSERIAFVPVGGKILVTDTWTPEYYDACDDYDATGRKMTKTQLVNEEQYVLVTKRALVRGLRSGGVIRSAKSSYGDTPLVFVREKKHVAFQAPCGNFGTMTVAEADKLADAIESL
jgi:hypothetical protein